MSSDSTLRIKAALKAIPRGMVTTYGAIAAAAGLVNGARQVVRVLHSSAESEGLPWHRILRKDGSIALPAGGGLELQKALLEEEGVLVDKEGRVELARFGCGQVEGRDAHAPRGQQASRKFKSSATPSSPAKKSPN
jgi:methylated-DNA-protein-cysteine methyltransferase-like protein